MTRREKLIARIRQRPTTANFGDVQALLEMFGWSQARTRGSHVTYTKDGEYPIVVSVHDKRVKRVYLNEICERLGLDDDTGS